MQRKVSSFNPSSHAAGDFGFRRGPGFCRLRTDRTEERVFNYRRARTAGGGKKRKMYNLHHHRAQFQARRHAEKRAGGGRGAGRCCSARSDFKKLRRDFGVAMAYHLGFWKTAREWTPPKFEGRNGICSAPIDQRTFLACLRNSARLARRRPVRVSKANSLKKFRAGPSMVYLARNEAGIGRTSARMEYSSWRFDPPPPPPITRLART